jgi:hypothetical protein
MMAIIILSCGFVLHSEPSAPQAKKAAGMAKQQPPRVTRLWHQLKNTASPRLSALYLPPR